MGNSRKSKDDLKWTEMLHDARAGEHQPPGKEWISRRDMKAKFGFSDGHMNKILADLIEAGKLERKMFKVWTGSRYYPMSYFREIK